MNFAISLSARKDVCCTNYPSLWTHCWLCWWPKWKWNFLEVGFECEAMNRLVAEVFLAKTKIKTCKWSFGEIWRGFLSLCADYKIPLIQLLCSAWNFRSICGWFNAFSRCFDSQVFAGIQKLELFSTMWRWRKVTNNFSPLEAIPGMTRCLSWTLRHSHRQKRWNCLHSEDFFCQKLLMSIYLLGAIRDNSSLVASIPNFPFCPLTKLHRRRCNVAR